MKKSLKWRDRGPFVNQKFFTFDTSWHGTMMVAPVNLMSEEEFVKRCNRLI